MLWLCGFLALVLLPQLPTSDAQEEPAATPAATPAGNADETEFFEKRIRPFLALECYDCHGAKSSEANLRLDHREGLLRGGDSGPAIVPGQADDSLLIRSIKHQHDDLQMPLDRPKLTDAVIADFVRWVNQGAVDPRVNPPDADASPDADWNQVFAARQAWWSFQPPQQSPVPDVQHEDWSSHPIDRFILATLESNQMKPGATAQPLVWLRRTHLAITGIPPSLAESQAFQRDSSPAAREQVVDRLLASPHFGERWGRHWLDLMRYAESYGHEQDYDIPHVWQYRDYVIRALNADVPYDQFVREHIAGDLLSEPRRDPATRRNESIVATGFWYLHQATHAPVDPNQDEADRIDNQIDVFSKAFFGLTVACARCHDHKFDAISTRDYYSLAAFLRSSRQDIAYLDPDGTLEARLAELRKSHAQTTSRVRDTLRRALDAGAPRLADYLSAAQEVLDLPPTGTESGTDQATTLRASVELVAKERDLNVEFLQRWVEQCRPPASPEPAHPLHAWIGLPKTVDTSHAADSSSRSAVAVPTDSETTNTVALDLRTWINSGQAFAPIGEDSSLWRAQGSFLEFVPRGMLHSGCVSDALQGVSRSPTFTIDRDYIHLRLSGKGQVRLIVARYGLREFNPLLFGEMQFDVDTDGRFEWRTLHRDIRRQKGKLAYLELLDNGSGSIALDRVELSDESQVPGTTDKAAASAPTSREEWAQQFERRAHESLERWLAGEGETDREFPLIWLARKGLLDWGVCDLDMSQWARDWSAEAGRAIPDPIRVLAMTDGTPEPTHVFIRGEHRLPGDLVQRRGLEAISGDGPLDIVAGSGRRELAATLTDHRDPLLDRVFVNRVWGHLFGRGLVATVDNFGALGERPSHPELLDHLALWFRAHDRSLKQLIRHLCLTETFALSSEVDPQVDANSAQSRDPDNRLLHRRSIQRLEAEAIRDQMLVVSGTLDATPFGPSVPTHLSPFMGDPFWLTSRGIASGPADGAHRRSIYLGTRRNFLSPFMLAFDFVAPETTVGQRHSTNVPAQSLALMNDPFVHQLAAEWAQKELAEDKQRDAATVTPEARLERIFWRALARPPRVDETESLMALLRSQAEQQGLMEAKALDDPQLWADICHIVFMLKEFIYVP
ncbi:MAG: PSD1 and planctomycete cytochrome C domain-containing protein [Pirellulaceae bacterium]|nr:PSD1 and planctomycete cytochrome C domain-containing protein [Pirellulaceae bacterium]